MHIVMITPEIAPAAKVGGLADMVTGLARALNKRGHFVEIIMPKYSCMRYDKVEWLEEEWQQLWLPHWNEWRCEKVYTGLVEGIRCHFITGLNYFERDKIYGFDDDIYRFSYFNRAALEFLFKSGRRPDIIHTHDWSTALVPVLYYEIYQQLGWTNARLVFTIHNNECQGIHGNPGHLLGMVGLNAASLMRPDKLRDDTKQNCLNLLRGAVVYSNFITAVSPSFAGEMMQAAGGRGLEHVFRAFSGKIGGVINGIDTEEYNPATDPAIPSHYDVDHFNNKYKNKEALRQWLGMDDGWKPIIAVISRLTQQKGIDLIKHALYATLGQWGQFIILGSAFDNAINADFWRIKNELSSNRNVHLWLGHHEDLSHLIYAGADMILVPSIFEPCGLTQLVAMRYGTVPIVRRTGGLGDTVSDLDYSGANLQGDANSGVNGFVFNDPNTAGLDTALNRAIRCYFDNPETFHQLAINGMRRDWSWNNSASDYINIYDHIRCR